MGIDWKGGDAVRRILAARDLERAGLSTKAIEVLFDVGVFNTQDLVNQPWSDEDAGQRFASLRWRLSVSPSCNAKLLSQVEAARQRSLNGPGAV